MLAMGFVGALLYRTLKWIYLLLRNTVVDITATAQL